MKRNPSIELYRCLLMYGICLLHAVTQCGHNVPWLANVLTTCVVGFVFISGWFGVKFTWWKLVKLYGIGTYAALVLFVGLCLRDGGGGLMQRKPIISLCMASGFCTLTLL